MAHDDGTDTDTDRYVRAPQSSPTAADPVPADGPGGGTPAPAPGGSNGWGDLTEALLRNDLDRAQRLRDRHLRAARLMSAVSWALCALGAVSAALCILSDLLWNSSAATGVLAGISGVCNALQRVPGPGETSAKLYDLATRADVAAAKIASIIDTPRANRTDAGVVLAHIGALVGAAQAPASAPNTSTPTQTPLAAVSVRRV